MLVGFSSWRRWRWFAAWALVGWAGPALVAAPVVARKTDAKFAMAQLVAMQTKGARVITVVPNGSMQAVFREKAYLVVEPVSYDELKVGDVVTYQHPTRRVTVVQRLLEKRGNGYVGNDGQAGDAALGRTAAQLMRVFVIIYAG